MITQELIATELGSILASMGKPVCNAAKWQQELGANAPTEAEILAKKAELDAAKASVTTDKAIYEAAIAAGFNVPDSSIVLSVSQSSIRILNDYATHLDRMFQAGLIEATTLIDICDKDDAWHKVSYQDFIDILIPIGQRALEVYQLGKKAGIN